jgi:hypothetical protein
LKEQSTGRTPPETKITLVSKANPCTGSRGKRLDLLKIGITVGTYREACDRKKLNANTSFLRMLAEAKHIKLG